MHAHDQAEHMLADSRQMHHIARPVQQHPRILPCTCQETPRFIIAIEQATTAAMANAVIKAAATPLPAKGPPVPYACI
jgi:hypothetical protein